MRLGVIFLNNCLLFKVEILPSPNDEVLRAIANKHGEIADKVFRGLKNTIQRAQSYTGYFCIVLYNESTDIIGCANFIQNSKQQSEWFYTDLWVDNNYRRKGNAKRLVTAGCDYLRGIGAKTLLCTVDEENTPSVNTQISLGFKEIESQYFEFFDNTGLLMFSKKLNNG